jgi:hypothetical protein
MNIDALYQRVTEAILRAEALETNAPSVEAAQAYLTVSFVEEEIAEALPASEEEGAIARRGAVRAALTAGLPTRAKELAERYLVEPDAPPELAEQLREMAARADAALETPPCTSVLVIPEARYRLHDEAA